MDPQKDNYKGLEQKMALNIGDLRLFNSDSYLVFIYKKTQSLINALYMVTNLFPEAEPLKWTIRSKAVTLLEDILSLPAKAFSERKNVLTRFAGKVLEIVSLCEVSSGSALMSGMNFRILNREFENLISLIEKHEEPYQMGSGFVLDEQLFKIPNPPTFSTSSIKKTMPSVKGQSILKDNLSVKVEIKDNRQEAILSFLKDKGNEQSIKDIGEALKDCSEKTLQRELQRMVTEGRLKKTGERRWSRYSLL